jgi:hypothetical protein
MALTNDIEKSQFCIDYSKIACGVCWISFGHDRGSCGLCGHWFCRDCWSSLSGPNKCPVCTRPICEVRIEVREVHVEVKEPVLPPSRRKVYVKSRRLVSPQQRGNRAKEIVAIAVKKEAFVNGVFELKVDESVVNRFNAYAPSIMLLLKDACNEYGGQVSMAKSLAETFTYYMKAYGTGRMFPGCESFITSN